MPRRSRYVNYSLPVVLLIGAAVFIFTFLTTNQDLQDTTVVLPVEFSVLLILLLLTPIFYIFFKLQKNDQRLKALQLIDITSMSGIEFEKYLAFLLRKRSFSRVEVTHAQGDFGADLIAIKDGKKYAIQAKRYKGLVGVSALYECFGGEKYYGCDESIVITNSYFTPAAKELAKKKLNSSSRSRHARQLDY